MDRGLDEPRRPFTVDEVERMAAAGVLGEDDRVELIEGELLLRSPQDPPHASVIERLTSRLVAAYGERYRVRVQLPLVISASSMPEPDLAVVRGDDRSYEAQHPVGADAILVVEVSWTSARRDQRKADLYARGGVPVYWRLDIETRRLEVHERPSPDGMYTLVQVHAGAAEVAAPDARDAWRIEDLLPSR